LRKAREAKTRLPPHSKELRYLKIKNSISGVLRTNSIQSGVAIRNPDSKSKAVSRSSLRKAREAKDALATALQGIALFKDQKFH
jgi:hypothetical protein